MVFSFFNSTYGPKDFLNKTPEEIVEMKVNKIDENFFETSAKDKPEDFNQLTPESKGAIQLLIDLKHKINIYNKFYKPNGARRSIKPGHRTAQAPAAQQAQAAQQASAAQQAPAAQAAQQAPVQAAIAAAEVVEDIMEGGRRKHTKKYKKRVRKHKRTNKKA
jgi:hypothetical protein